MRKTRQEITDEKVLEEILNGAIICRVAMMDENQPYILPFNYGYEDGKMYIHSAPEGKKIDLLKKNPKVCFEVEDRAELLKGKKACDWATLYRSVVGYGEIEILSDEQSKQKCLEIIMAQHGAPELVDFSPKNMARMVILVLSINSMSGKQSSNWNTHIP